MDTREFGARLRELREQAGLSQGQLADKVGVDFTYLSKIESGAKPPPSKKVILRLADALGGGRDDLLARAGKVPSGIVEILKNQENLQSLRAGRIPKKIRAADKKASFNIRLRELREQAGLSQRKLADKVGVSYSYLSKIEKGVVEPPSKSLILKLAEVLNADKDELLILAGRIPADVLETILKNREALQSLRARSFWKGLGDLRGATNSIEKLATSLKNSTVASAMSLKNNSRLLRVPASILVTFAIVGLLLFVQTPPASAVSFSITAPSSGYLGQTYEFDVQVNVENTDKLPIARVDLLIYNTDDHSYIATLENLPLSDVATPQSHTIQEGSSSGSATVTVSTGVTWGTASITNRVGYGYGYTTSTWDTYTEATNSVGYGYDNVATSYIGVTTVTYTIRWTSPSGWPAATYEIQPIVYVTDGSSPSNGLTQQPPLDSFTLSTAAAPSGDGGGVYKAPAAPEGVTDLTGRIARTGKFTQRVTAKSEDNKVSLKINRDTIGLTEEGRALSEISITEMEDPPAPPENANIIGLTYDFGPDGATFDPPTTLTFTYDPDEISEDIDEEDLVIAMWDEAAGEWVELVCVVDPETNTITAEVSHFTVFTIIAAAPVTPPAPTPPAPPVPTPPAPTPPTPPAPTPPAPVTPPVTPVVPAAPSVFPWWWVVIGVVVVCVLVYFLWWRRRVA